MDSKVIAEIADSSHSYLNSLKIWLKAFVTCDIFKYFWRNTTGNITMTNPVSNHDMKVFSGVSNPELSRRLARYCGVTMSTCDFCLHNNGDHTAQLVPWSHPRNIWRVPPSQFNLAIVWIAPELKIPRSIIKKSGALVSNLAEYYFVLDWRGLASRRTISKWAIVPLLPVFTPNINTK